MLSNFIITYKPYSTATWGDPIVSKERSNHNVTMSDAPTRYTSYVYPMSHNMCTRHTRHTRPARRTYCADYLQSDARGEVLTPT